MVYDLANHTVVNASSLAGTNSGTSSGGNLVATSGGVWGTTGVGMSEWTWFAPDGDLSRAVRIGQGAGAGFASVPSYSAGVVWVGGSHTLSCANPANGRVLDTATLPTDHSVVEYFGSPAVAGGHAYSYYQDDQSQQSGLVRMTPPAACSGMTPARRLLRQPSAPRARPGARVRPPQPHRAAAGPAASRRRTAARPAPHVQSQPDGVSPARPGRICATGSGRCAPLLAVLPRSD